MATINNDIYTSNRKRTRPVFSTVLSYRKWRTFQGYRESRTVSGNIRETVEDGNVASPDQ